ncbi:breast carcinoma-amplified sequence 1 isoform X2 [Erpetoichthys calabaricus]|uniref:breast carcinoma-amplified sequence 1 isoform X2 n=1 Tax=Erpetoichthys calabaricus TaxID=27687 RepID=UPI002234BA8E|nr:breast carcinoma-amplified sequence 1 isoform X2 [Erpetoichthys calabaricus]
MGNEASSPETSEASDAEDNTYDGKLMPEDFQNDGPDVQPVHVTDGNCVQSKADVQLNTEAPSSRQTMEISTSTGLQEDKAGKDANNAPPAAKSLFSMSFSRSVPSRTEPSSVVDSSSVASISSPENRTANRYTAEKTVTFQTSNPGQQSVPKEERRAGEATQSEERSEAPQTGPRVEPKASQKEKSFFDNFFKSSVSETETGKPDDKINLEQSPVNHTCLPAQEELVAQVSNVQHASSADNNNLSVKLGNSTNKAAGSAAVPPINAELRSGAEGSIKEEAPAEDSSVMNFFKTFVSPSKTSKSDNEALETSKEKKRVEVSAEATTKPEKEQKPTKIEKAQGIQSNTQRSGKPEAMSESAAVKEPDVPAKQKGDKEPTPSPFIKLFRQKSSKDGSQTDDTRSNGTQEVDAAPSSVQEASKVENKNVEVLPKQKGTLVDPPKETPNELESPVKQKPAKESSPNPFSKLFKQKDQVDSPQVEVQIPSILSQPVESKTPEAKPAEETKPAKSTFVSFFKQLTVKEEEPVANSLQANEKDSPVTTLDPKNKSEAKEMPAPLSTVKEEDKSLQEMKKKNGRKEDVLEAPSPTEEVMKETPKRLEKRPSIGGFFKGLGSKRMSDAEVQTDPVSILPLEKAK